MLSEPKKMKVSIQEKVNILAKTDALKQHKLC
jgi:hypothetical protein